MKINEYYYHLKGKDDFVTKNHMHNEIELIQVLSGSGTVLKDDKPYILQSRFLYIIDARKPHIVNPQACNDYVRNKIVIDADSFFETCSLLGLKDLAGQILTLPPIPTDGDMEFDRLFEKVSRLCSSNKKEDAGFACGHVLDIMRRATQTVRDETPAADMMPVIRETLNVIMKKNGMTSLREISDELHVNKYYLCHLFKQETGITLSDYLAEKRYEKCVLYLSETFYPVEKIAALCGFSSTSSLTRFFKRKSGLCPKDFRKKHSRTTPDKA